MYFTVDCPSLLTIIFSKETAEFIPNTAVFGPTKLIETIGTARLKISAEDFYGGRTGPLEKFYLFIFFC